MNAIDLKRLLPKFENKYGWNTEKPNKLKDLKAYYQDVLRLMAFDQNLGQTKTDEKETDADETEKPDLI